MNVNPHAGVMQRYFLLLSVLTGRIQTGSCCGGTPHARPSTLAIPGLKKELSSCPKANYRTLTTCTLPHRKAVTISPRHQGRWSMSRVLGWSRASVENLALVCRKSLEQEGARRCSGILNLHPKPRLLPMSRNLNAV